MSDDTPRVDQLRQTADTTAERLTQIRARSTRLAAIPLETSASNHIMRDMIDSIGDVQWLLAAREQAQDQRVADVLAVAEACAGVVDGTAPQPIRHEYAVRRLRDRFAGRIAELDARDAKAPTHCICGCALGKPCACDGNADHEPDVAHEHAHQDISTAKFTAEMEQLRANNPAGARWLDSILAERAAGTPQPDHGCAHCGRDLTGASTYTIQGIDVCADIRHCLMRQKEQRARAEQAEAIVVRVTNQMQEYDRWGSGMVNVRQVLNLLSPTWPDGNYAAAPEGGDRG